jgi:lysophospholipase L1-like esterase
VHQGVGSKTGIQTDNTASSTATSGGYANPVTGQDMVIRFRASCERIKIWAVTGTSKVAYAIDGIEQSTGGTLSTPTGTLWNWCDIVTGLDPLVEHEYTVYIDQTTATGTAQIADLMLVGGTGLVTSSTPAARVQWGFYGDSIWRGVAGTGADCFKATPHDFCAGRMQALRMLGVSGRLVSGASGTAGQLQTQVDLIPTTVTFVVVLLGLNDATQSGGVETSATFRTAYDDMLTKIRTRIGASKHIYCLGILNTSNATGAANRSAFNTEISGAVTAQADAFTHYLSTDNWIVPGTDTSDGSHPTEAGYTKITTQLNIAIPATVSGSIAQQAGAFYTAKIRRKP